MNTLKKLLALAISILIGQTSLHAQMSGQPVVFDLETRSFVENRGQFDCRLPQDSVRYAFELDGQQIFLADQKVYFNLYHVEPRVKSEEEKAERTSRKKLGFESYDEYTAFQKAGKKFNYTSDMLEATWVNSNPGVQFEASEMDAHTHTYEYKQGTKVLTRSGIPSFKKITYKNLYPNIDVEYTIHPKSGIKYSLILHPGADLSQVKLRYSKMPELRPEGSIETTTLFGLITDHPPVSFYEGSNIPIASSYAVNGNDISFVLASYDPTKTVIIDPWTDLPNDPSTNWDCAWECETDGLGNSYAIFGAMPLQLRKYNAAGAIQWTYNTTYDTTSWLGTFVTDNAGNSYVTNGSTAAIRKVSPAGALLWSVGNITGQLLGEFWNIAFNCDQTKLITGGTGGGLSPIPYIYEINPANGALMGSIMVHQGTGLFSPSEVRGITATENAKYYWLSHDSIGFISQSFSACPNPGSTLIAVNGYDLSYKCENWRYDNTGIEAMAYYGGFVYVHRGNRLDKRNPATGAIVASVAIPAGGFVGGFGGSYVENSGIIIDNTGRIFVGSKGSVSQFNTSLALIGTYPVTAGFTVYDVALTSTGEVIACGASGTSGTASRTGYVQSLGVLGAAPYVMPCCDASICAAGPLCDDGAPITLQAGVAGGTWSSSAPGFNPATGVFDPTIAGIGTYTFYYSLVCGLDSVTIDVVFCPTLTVCRETNGNLTVSNGAPTYTWQTGTMVASCPFGSGPGCALFTYSVSTFTWTTFTTGTTVTPPIGTDTLRVYDASLEFVTWNIATLPPCGPLPVEIVQFNGNSIGEHTNALAWTTQSEDNVHHFTVESSGDGVSFQAIGSVQATGNPGAESNYELTDFKAYPNLTYYRLWETTMNGSYHHLSTIAVSTENSNDFILNVFPIPASDRINFTYTGPKSDQELTVSLINELGATVLVKSWKGLAHNSTMAVNVAELASGLYEMRFKMGSEVSYRKVLVMQDK